MKIYFITIFFVVVLSAQNQLPTGSNDLFSGSGNCESCHTRSGSVLTFNGVDISPVTQWRSSMMANSSKDPFWRAEVSEEVQEFPQLQELIESTCTKCHSPMGYTNEIFSGGTSYSINQLKQDTLANDGVSCTLCHQVQPDNLGSQSSYSGNYLIENVDEIYGPYQNPLTMPMVGFVGYTPVHSAHVNQSELCAACHTLLTPYIDNNGQIAGTFPEQTPYLEWKNSDYPAMEIECQTCHMPQVFDPIDIAQLPPWHTEMRTPFWQHKFVGANNFMLNLIKSNIDSVGTTSGAENLDSTISFTRKSLMEQSVDLELKANFLDDSVKVDLGVLNLSGHKIPTGIPFRRMWVHIKAVDTENNIVFESGNWDENGEIIGLDENYEPHHNLITENSQVQVYESIMKNVDDEVTYTLLRAESFLKDNRIPPKGFTSSHFSYDTTAIYGLAFEDVNFNRAGGSEGSGMDLVTYKFPAVEEKNYVITAEVCYQTLTPRLVEHLNEFDTPDINRFLEMYNQADKTAFIMKTIETSINIPTGVSEEPNLMGYKLEQNYPNPFNPVTKIKFSVPLNLETHGNASLQLSIYDLLGKELKTLINKPMEPGTYEVEFNGSGLPSGVYYYRLTAGEFSDIKKLMLLK